MLSLLRFNNNSDRSGNVSSRATAIVVLVGAIIVTSAVLISSMGGFSKLEPLPASAYRAEPEAYLGDRYRLTAQVHSLLLWEEGTGRLFAVIPEGDQGRLSVFVPESLNKILHTGQGYHMDVAVREGGLLYVEGLEKY